MIPSVVGKSDEEVECLMVPTSSDRLAMLVTIFKKESRHMTRKQCDSHFQTPLPLRLMDISYV